jgi:RNA polymerase sigma-70 factor (ECF subfamily)
MLSQFAIAKIKSPLERLITKERRCVCIRREKGRMLFEERVLLWRLKRGDKDALRSIYESYKDELLALALSLYVDRSIAEDIVHDVFVAFARVAPTLRLRNSLKSYLYTAVANRIRSLRRQSQLRRRLGRHGPIAENADEIQDPVEKMVRSEQLDKAYRAIQTLPYEQREALVMRLQCGLSFRQIAKALGSSTHTALSRYRYALIKLRSMLNSETEK